MSSKQDLLSVHPFILLETRTIKPKIQTKNHEKIILHLTFFLMSMQPLPARESSLLKGINVTSTSSGLHIYKSIAVGNMICMIIFIVFLA